jgi:ABC-type polysaccharide/polyol phosphate export permease
MIKSLKRTAFNSYYIKSVLTLIKYAIKVEYNRSFLGLIWVAIKPCIYVILFGFTMPLIFGFEAKNYPLFIASNFITWGFIVSTLTSSGTLVGKSSFINNKIVSKTTFVAVNMGKQFTIYLISIVFSCALSYIICQVSPTWHILLLPIYLFGLFLAMFSISMALNFIYPYTQDFAYIIELSVPFLMWISPVMYHYDFITNHKIKMIMDINPLVTLMMPITNLIYDQKLPSFTLNISYLICLFGIVSISLIIYLFLRKRVVFYLN